MMEPDNTLVQRAQAGDRAAFELLVRRTSRLVYARLYVEVGDTHHAEDLLQETLLTAFRTLKQLQNPDKFRAWLLRIAQNVVIDAARRDGRKKRTPVLALHQSEPTTPEPSEILEREETKQQVLAILRTLPDEYRLPLVLRHIVGADYETIQTQMGLTNGALRGLLHRGMEHLRVAMHEALGEDYI
ncbi:MAG: sigma-70 family RNA polymerase sigma factor [Planctomycetes bacterium]|jgi:RNA polymerase sigma-70 factor (ECF subfamily)|nr:sigma-70 family RNA polymerase sigma factor [Planctomycetota bacterium]